MKTPFYKFIQSKEILAQAKKILPTGKLRQTSNHLVYLDVADDFIHALYPLLTMTGVKKPRYFAESGIGAHISVIYPEEKLLTDLAGIGEQHGFNIQDIVAATLAHKTYYILRVLAPTLIALRQQYNLPAALNFKGYAVDLHLTFAVAYR